MFQHFDVLKEEECFADYLQINDGPSASYPLIGQYCGNDLPNGGSFNATNQSFFLLFGSLIGCKRGTCATGFVVNWKSI